MIATASSVRMGQSFGRWTVVSGVVVSNKRHRHVLCRCECGTERYVRLAPLLAGEKRSCGCQRGGPRKRRAKHSPKMRQTWYQMVARCTKASHPSFKDYGGRGITVCDRWLNSLQAFCEDIGEIPPGLTLDRIDNSKGYSPDNVRLATQRVQMRNRRVTRYYTHNGVTQSVADWADDAVVSAACLNNRLKLGWPMDAARMTPVGSFHRWNNPLPRKREATA